VSLGATPGQQDLFRSTAGFCDTRVDPDSIYGVLHRECFRLFPDAMFADLFTDVGRRPVPPQIVAVVTVLQRLGGCSDREAADRFAFDLRWKYAAGGLDYDYPGFVHTVPVDVRARLARSDHPDRIFDKTSEAARAAGLAGRRRVVDSTPVYDAVAAMDTVTLIRSAIRGLLAAAGRADPESEARLRGLPARDDDYAAPGKPACDRADAAAREQLVDALARDASALPAALDGAELAPALTEAAALPATVVGQDLDAGADGVFRIARGVAKNRVISTVDPEARHGHKTAARGFDGYKAHVAEDPDSEIITKTAVTAGDSGDAEAAEGLLADVLPPRPAVPEPPPAGGPDPDPADSGDAEVEPDAAPAPAPDAETAPAGGPDPDPAETAPPAGPGAAGSGEAAGPAGREPGPAVYGRRARVRGRAEVAADFALLAAAVNLARLAALGLTHTAAGWAAAG
jgi:hypothetical protein